MVAERYIVTAHRFMHQSRPKDKMFMIALNWKPFGINVGNRLENEINVHNGTIIEKADHFEDI